MPIDAQPRSARPALAGGARPCSTSSTRRGRRRWRSGSPRRGGTVVGGLEVLFWQATVQVELMTGQPAPIARDARARSTPPSPPAEPSVELSRPVLLGAALVLAVVVRAVARRRRRPAGRPGRRRAAGPARTARLTALFAVLLVGAVLSPACGRRPSPGVGRRCRRRARRGRPGLPPAARPGHLSRVRRLRRRAARRRRRARRRGRPCCAPSSPRPRLRGRRRWPRRSPPRAGVRRREAAGAARPAARLVGLGRRCWRGCSSACSSAALVSVVLLATRRAGWRTAVPFGPPLLAGAALALALVGPSAPG